MVDDGSTTWVTPSPGPGAPRVADSMRFLLRVELADVSRTTPFSTSRGGRSGPGEPMREPCSLTVGDTAAYPLGPPGSARHWREVTVPRADLIAAVGDRPGRPIWAAADVCGSRRGATARPRDRPPHHRPRGDWLRTAVHLHKWCTGAGTVARVHNLGRPRPRLVFLHLDGSGTSAGSGRRPCRARRSSDRRVRGSSVARAHERTDCRPRRKAAGRSTMLLAGGIAAAQEVVVTPSTTRPRPSGRAPHHRGPDGGGVGKADFPAAATTLEELVETGCVVSRRRVDDPQTSATASTVRRSNGHSRRG